MSEIQRLTYDGTWKSCQREIARLEDTLEQRWNTLSASQRLQLARRIAYCNLRLDNLYAIACQYGLVA